MPAAQTTAEVTRRLLASADYAMKTVYEPMIARLMVGWQAGEAASASRALASGIAQLRASSLLIGAGGLVTTLVVPLAVWVGVWAAMGAGYAEAKALVKKDKFQSGFSRGFVMRLLGWHWDHVISRFFSPSPPFINPFDESISEAGNNAYNEGLRAGYVHASSIDQNSRTALLTRLKSLSPMIRAGKAWSRVDQIDYVTYMAGFGRAHNVFVAPE